MEQMYGSVPAECEYSACFLLVFQVFEPGHYVAIDRKAQKIIVSVR